MESRRRTYGGDNIFNAPEEGLLLYASLKEDVTTCETGQTITKHNSAASDPVTWQTFKNVPCVRVGYYTSDFAYESYLLLDFGLISGNASRSMSVWIHGVSTASYSMAIRNGLLNSGGNQWEIGYSNATNNYLYAGSWAVGANSTISALSWHHVVFTFDGSLIKLYIDGEFISSASKTFNTTASQIYVGGGGYYPVDAYMAGLRVYNRALTAEEVLVLSTEFKPE